MPRLADREAALTSDEYPKSKEIWLRADEVGAQLNTYMTMQEARDEVDRCAILIEVKKAGLA